MISREVINVAGQSFTIGETPAPNKVLIKATISAKTINVPLVATVSQILIQVLRVVESASGPPGNKAAATRLALRITGVVGFALW